MSLGKRRISNVRDYDDCDYECESENEIKKGPWKVEEDEVLLNHVEKYGPRDWSSIRSKGLLQRTGKSCRLRWVNKLRPDLKNGVKFSAEEERTVIELQAKFGNKWARIATYLKGRTDNDVKNFWSSRQKRLARILHNSASSSSSNSHYKCNKKVRATGFHRVSSVEAPITDEESFIKSQSCSLPHMDNSQTIKTIPLPELVYPSLLSYEGIPMQRDYSPPMKIELQPMLIQQNYRSPVKIEPQPIPIQQNYRSPVKLQPYFSFSEIPLVKVEPPPHLLVPETPEVKPEIPLAKMEPPTHLSFPETPEVKIEPHPHLLFPETPLLQPDFPLPLDQDFIARLGDSSFMDELSGSPQIPIMPSFFIQDQSCEISGTSESFIDDFPPIDMFDHIEPLPSPSEWS